MEIIRTTRNINNEELVIDISNPKMFMGRSIFTSNDNIGLIKTDNLLRSNPKIPYLYSTTKLDLSIEILVSRQHLI